MTSDKPSSPDSACPPCPPSKPPANMSTPFLSEDLRRRILQRAEIYVKSAIAMGSLETLKDVYKFARVTTLDKDGNTALHYAARKGDHVLLRWLLKYSGVCVTAPNRHQENCCHVAVKHGNLTCLRYAIYCGEFRPVVIAWERDVNGMTLLHLAAFGGYLDVACWLLDTFGKSLAQVKNNRGQTPIHLAAARGHLPCLRTICRSISNEINLQDDTGATAVFYAAQEGHVQCLYFLVETAQADPKIATNTQVTPLMAATQTGRLDIVNFLLQKSGDDILSRQARDGATVYHMAAANGREDVLEFLLSKKASRDALCLVDSKGSSPAHDAAEYNHLGCLKMLLAAGLDVMLQDQDGESPYSLALRKSEGACAAYVRSLTGGEELDANSLERKLRATVAADASEMDFGKQVEQGKAKVTIDVSNHRNTLKEKLSRSLRNKLRERNQKNKENLEEPIIKGEYYLKDTQTEEQATQSYRGDIEAATKYVTVIFSDPNENKKPSTSNVTPATPYSGTSNRVRCSPFHKAEEEPIYSIPKKTPRRSVKAAELRSLKSPIKMKFDAIPEMPSISSSMEELNKVTDSVNDIDDNLHREFIETDSEGRTTRISITTGVNEGGERPTTPSPPEPPPLPLGQPSFGMSIFQKFKNKGRISSNDNPDIDINTTSSSPFGTPSQERMSRLKDKLKDSVNAPPYYDKIFHEFQESPIYKRMKQRYAVFAVEPEDPEPDPRPDTDAKEEVYISKPSPTRKKSIKFTYLPNGTLETPKLRHVNNDQIPPEEEHKPGFEDVVVVPENGNQEEDYHHLRQALIRRLNSPREIPEINMKKVRQYQKIHDPPSELELFFKNRKERLRRVGWPDLDADPEES